MPCYHPRKGFLLGEVDGVKHYKITEFDTDYLELIGGKWIPSKRENERQACKPIEGEKVLTEWIPIPCGKCIGCRLEYARQWTCRLQCESKMHPIEGQWFLTLTYDDEKMPLDCLVPDGADPSTGECKDYLTLVPDHVTLFIKRLRQHIKRDLKHDGKFTYFLAGEYGSQRKRPHYHMIAFELPIPESWLTPYKRNELGDQMYTCKWLEDIWSYGFVIIGHVTADSIGYTARYCMKKIKDGLVYDSTHRHPEYTRMSRNPGIGKSWLDENMEKVCEVPNIVMPSRKGHNTYMLPRYFISKLPEENAKQIKDNRKIAGKLTYERIASEGPYLERLASMEAIKKEQIKALKRS